MIKLKKLKIFWVDLGIQYFPQIQALSVLFEARKSGISNESILKK